MGLSSNKPYLIRAIYDWIVDNRLTPYLLVEVDYPGVQVPMEYVQDGKIILNISSQACRGLHLDNDRIVFTARFAGISQQIVVIPDAVIAIYSKENGRGMEFEIEKVKPVLKDLTIPMTPQASSSTKKKTVLRLVKNEDEQS